MRTALVILHAAPGVAGLVAGLQAIPPPRTGDGRTWWRRIYALCVAVLLGGLTVLLVYDWADLEPTGRLAFTGLAGLGAVIAIRLLLARRAARTGAIGWQRRYVDHLVFTYISLWVGFLVVPAINTAWPQVAIPVVVVAVVIAGSVLASRYKRRVPEISSAR